jgi:hypothetical protein
MWSCHNILPHHNLKYNRTNRSWTWTSETFLLLSWCLRCLLEWWKADWCSYLLLASHCGMLLLHRSQIWSPLSIPFPLQVTTICLLGKARNILVASSNTSVLQCVCLVHTKFCDFYFQVYLELVLISLIPLLFCCFKLRYLHPNLLKEHTN